MRPMRKETSEVNEEANDIMLGTSDETRKLYTKYCFSGRLSSDDRSLRGCLLVVDFSSVNH